MPSIQLLFFTDKSLNWSRYSRLTLMLFVRPNSYAKPT